MYAVTKTFQFSAAHRLEALTDPHHPCSRLHGHNYKVALRFEATSLDDSGFVIDTHRLGFFKKWIDMLCDHQNINETLLALAKQTTGERIAHYIASLLTGEWMELWTREGLWLVSVTVSETDTVTAEWFIAPPF